MKCKAKATDGCIPSSLRTGKFSEAVEVLKKIVYHVFSNQIKIVYVDLRGSLSITVRRQHHQKHRKYVRLI